MAPLSTRCHHSLHYPQRNAGVTAQPSRELQKHSSSSYLVQRQHQEGSPAAGIHDDGHEAGVDGAEGAVPGDAGHADVVVALVVLHRLAKDVPEFALSYHPPHGVCKRRGSVPGKGMSCLSRRFPGQGSALDVLSSSAAALLAMRKQRFARCSWDGLGWENPRMVGVGRDLWRFPLPQQGHPEQVTQECIQVGLGFLQTGRLHTLPGQFQCSATLHGKRFFLMLRWNSTWFSLWPLLLILLLGTAGKSLALSSWHQRP